MDLDKLQRRMSELDNQFQQQIAQANATQGAIQEVRKMILELRKNEEGSKERMEPPVKIVEKK